MKNDRNLEKIDSVMLWINYLVPLTILIVPLFKFESIYHINNFINQTTSFFLKDISIFATISTVLIGIFFSLFTVLLSFDVNSILIRIPKKNIKKLILLIFLAFLISFIFMWMPLVTNILPTLNLFSKRLIMIIFLFLSLLSFRIGVYFFLIINFDLENRIDGIKKDENAKEIEQKRIKKIYDHFF